MQLLCYFRAANNIRYYLHFYFYYLHKQILTYQHVTFHEFLGCILNPGHGKIPAPDFNFYIQKDKYPI